MSYTLDWQDEGKHAILITYGDKWTWEELYKSIDDSKAMMRTVPDQKVDIVVHMANNYLPKGGNLNLHGMSAIRNTEPNLRYIIVITNSMFVRKLMDVSRTVSKAMAEKYRVVTSLEEASG